MMPGVVAGFSAKPAGVSLVSASISADETGFIKGSYGSINPAFANVNPSVAPADETAGEILAITWGAALASDPSGYPAKVTLEINGSYASAAALPFSSLTIDGSVVLSKSSFTSFQSFGASCAIVWNRTTNPIPAGSHSLVFA